MAQKGKLTGFRALRLDQIMAFLRPGRVVSVLTLARRLGVSDRTIHRDIATLRQQGARIGGSTGHGGGLLLRPDIIRRKA